MGLISFFQKASETIHLGPEGAETPHGEIIITALSVLVGRWR